MNKNTFHIYQTMMINVLQENIDVDFVYKHFSVVKEVSEGKKRG